MEKIVKIFRFRRKLKERFLQQGPFAGRLRARSGGRQTGNFRPEGIPPFNQDLDNHPPQKVKEFKAKIRAADAILIATPEANYTLPGVLDQCDELGFKALWG